MKRLLIRPGALGDFIVSLPALEALATPQSEIWVPRENVPLVRFTSQVRALADTGLDLMGLPGIDPPQALLEKLSSFDQIVSWYGSANSDFREAVAAHRLPFVFFPALPTSQHACDFYAEQARTLGGAPQAIPRLPCPPAQRHFIAIHPFSGSKRKNWPAERFQELARHLEASSTVKFTAGPDEDWPGATRFESRYDLAVWLSAASLYIGNDSGVTHLAAAVGTPVVALFGPTDPNIWSPRGPSVTILQSPTKAVEDITLDTLWQTLKPQIHP